MVPRSVVLQSSTILVLIVSLTFLISSSDLSTNFKLPLLIPPSPSSPDRSSCPPLRVYMYDLPPRFNVEMLGYKHSTPPNSTNFPLLPRHFGVKRQHSVEYWMMGSLIVDDGDALEAVRVQNGDDADVFFVPFFSSLSFNSHGHNMTDPKTMVDRQLQADLIDFLKVSKYWKRSGGRDHVFPMTHPNAFRFHKDQINASIFVVVDFGRVLENVSSLHKDVVSPYVHLADVYPNDDFPDPYESRKTLLYFRGRTIRKDDGRIRVKLAKLLDGFADIHMEESRPSVSAIRAATQGMRSSKFCLNPAGDTPSSCRLFDAIISHCVPIIISDHIELPFEDEIDYREFSLFFSVEEALKPEYLVNKLREFPKEKWVEMWMKLKNVSHHYEFHYPPISGDSVGMLWKQVRHKLPEVNRQVHRSARLKIPEWLRRR